MAIAHNPEEFRIYVAGGNPGTVSIINPLSYEEEVIRVGLIPVRIAYDYNTHMVYVANQGRLQEGIQMPGTVLVINGVTDKVVAGVIFNIIPGYSGKIICNGVNVPTNTYLYVTVGTNCTAKHNECYYYDGWFVSSLTGYTFYHWYSHIHQIHSAIFHFLVMFYLSLYRTPR